MDAPYYNGAPGELFTDPGCAGGGARPRTEARVLGHCHDCAEGGELVTATRWFYDGLRELPMCAAHYRARDNYEPDYESGL